MLLYDSVSWVDIGTLVITGIGLVGTAIGLLFMYKQYTKGIKTKRAEFLETLTKEFNSSKMLLAKKILDDYWVDPSGTENQTDLKLLIEGAYQERPDELINAEIGNILRDHRVKPVTSNAEQRIRQSFDDLLDFFTKLDYYLKLELIEKEELNYFKYYIEKCAGKQGSILKYAVTYSFPALFRLFFALHIPIQEKEMTQYQIAALQNSAKHQKFQ